MNLKQTIKNIATFLRHPILTCYFFKQGSRNIYIGKRSLFKNYRNIKTKENFYIGNDARFLCVEHYRGTTYKPTVSIGNGCTIGNRVSILSAAPIEIGDGCMIASDVLITSENHGIEVENKNNFACQSLTTKSIKIGNNCWIGEKAVILPGTTLGEKCIVGAGGVVTKSFPSYSMVAGNPAKIIKTYNFGTHKWERVKQ